MRIVVTHLTRMQRGSVCVAGLNVQTGEHVRAVPPMGALPSRVTALHGGPFDMATVVNLGVTRPIPEAPEIEDHELTWWHARAERRIEADLMWDMLRVVGKPSLRQLFGPSLRYLGYPRSRRAVLDIGEGQASLGVLVPHGRPQLTLAQKPDGRDVVRLEFSDGQFSLDLSVTDLRLYTDDGGRPAVDRVQDIASRLARGVGVRLSVGLTRPFASRAGDTPVHWLQVNNLHLEDDPCWRLAPDLPSARGRQLVGAGVADTDQDELPF